LYSLRDALKEIRNLGYEYVELAANISETPHFAAHSAGEEGIAGLRKLLEAFNLQLAAIDIGGWDAPFCLANLEESQRAVAVQNVRRSIDAASELGCALVTSHLWGLPENRNPATVSSYREAFMASIAEICPLLGGRDVRLNFMPHPGGFIEESDPVVDLIRETGCPNIGYTYGIGHTFVISLPGQEATEMIAYAGKTLTHVLVSDTHHLGRIIAPPEVKAHEHLVPGSGDIDFTAILTTLRDTGYDNFLSVHIISEADRIVEAARKTKQKLEWFLGALAC
jgi:sugar phosphate isomerase/epimerase